MTPPKPCKFHRRFSPNKRVCSMTWEFFTDDSLGYSLPQFFVIIPESDVVFCGYSGPIVTCHRFRSYRCDRSGSNQPFFSRIAVNFAVLALLRATRGPRS